MPEVRSQKSEVRSQKSEVRSQNQIRYRLHSKIRKQGYKLVTKKRTIYVYFKNTDFSKEALQLRNEFGYAIQTEI